MRSAKTLREHTKSAAFSSAEGSAVDLAGVTPLPALSKAPLGSFPRAERDPEARGDVGLTPPSSRFDYEEFAYFVLKIATVALWTAVGIVIMNLWKLGII